jgi:hypothetical protein
MNSLYPLVTKLLSTATLVELGISKNCEIDGRFLTCHVGALLNKYYSPGQLFHIDVKDCVQLTTEDVNSFINSIQAKIKVSVSHNAILFDHSTESVRKYLHQILDAPTTQV